MKGDLYIPEEVKQDIQEYLSKKYLVALEKFYHYETEDDLSAHLGGKFETEEDKKVLVTRDGVSDFWKWGINFVKFKDKAYGATEKKLGADGIFELIIGNNSWRKRKSLLFQAKLNWENDPKLIGQAIKLTTWREAAFILNFTSNKFEAIDLDTILESQGKRSNIKENIITLDKYIGTTFLDCLVGNINLRYDAVSKKLVWETAKRDTKGKWIWETVATKFPVRHRTTIQITAPNTKYDQIKFDKEIKNSEIHDYRMYAKKEQMLSLNDDYNDAELKKAKASKLLIYHPDKFPNISKHEEYELLKQIINRRTQEIIEIE